MNVKRVLTTIIGGPLVVACLILANKYIIDVIMTIVALISMYEYIKCCSNKDVKVVKWISYLAMIPIAFTHFMPLDLLPTIACITLPLIMLILFMCVIFTSMRITFQDIAFTLFGIVYIFIANFFFALVYGIEEYGKIFIFLVILSAWCTDIFAFIVGMRIGKHKITQVSPKKSLEGCIGGTVAAIICCVIYAYCININMGMNFDLVVIAKLAFLFSIVGQIGDLAASCIKRYFEVKDYSNLFPGHGGMLDRIDSLMFIAPLAFILLKVLM